MKIGFVRTHSMCGKRRPPGAGWQEKQNGNPHRCLERHVNLVPALGEERQAVKHGTGLFSFNRCFEEMDGLLLLGEE